MRFFFFLNEHEQKFPLHLLSCPGNYEYVMLCAIWYHLYYLKNVKYTYGGKPATLLKVTLLHGCFSCFLNCTNGTKSRKESHMNIRKPFSVFQG